MEPNYTPLSDIDPMLDDVKVFARCISRWKSHPAGKPNEVWSLDMVLQDPQGNRVQATVRTKENINKFQLLIDEGSCYRIGNFGVGENGGKFPLLNHRFKIAFFKNTSITRLPSFDNNVCGFKFEPFPNFASKRFTDTDVVDVIGTIVSITDPVPFNSSGVDQIRRNVVLEDPDGFKLECCFFDDWAAKFNKYSDNCESHGHVVLILQVAKVKYFNGNTSVRPAIFSTKIYINDAIPEIVAFRQRYAEVDGYDPKKHTITVCTPVKKVVSPFEFLEGAVKKMVGNIRDSDRACHVVVYAKIHKIHRENGWAYLACKRCGSAAKEVQNTTSSSGSNYKSKQTWKCKQHNEITAVGMRFKVIVRVIDDTGSASLLLFDDFVNKLCGVTCHNLIKEHGEEHENYFPSELNVMVGKKLLFCFHYTDYNMNNNYHVYTVKMMSEEEVVINAFKTDFITEEPVTADEMQTPVLSAVKLNKFSSAKNIPFNIEATPPTTKGIQDSGKATGSSGSGKRTIIDLDGYDDSQQEAKRLLTKGDIDLVEVKIEPKE